MTEDQMWNMSDDELESAFLEVRADEGSPDTEIENDIQEDEETLEQPVEDSDDDSTTDDTEEIEVDEESETEDGEPDEELELDEDQTEETGKEPEETVEQVQSYKFKANGREYEFSRDEMLEQFPKIFGQAMDYTRKTQAIKPWRKTIDALESAKVSHEDVNLFIDVLKGDKGAITEVLKRTGVDALDLDLEGSKYQPKDYGRDDTALAIKDIVDEISVDKEYDVTHRILSKEWDSNSFNEMTKNPTLIKLLHTDVKTGTYDKVQAIAEKLKIFDGGNTGKSDLDYYKDAAREYFGGQQEQERRARAAELASQEKAAREAKLAEVARVKAKQAKVQATKEEAPRRKAAAPTKSNAGTKKVVDYLDDSDEAYEEWYSKMQAKY